MRKLIFGTYLLVGCAGEPDSGDGDAAGSESTEVSDSTDADVTDVERPWMVPVDVTFQAWDPVNECFRAPQVFPMKRAYWYRWETDSEFHETDFNVLTTTGLCLRIREVPFEFHWARNPFVWDPWIQGNAADLPGCQENTLPRVDCP